MALSSSKSPDLSLRQQAIEWLVLLRSDDFGEKEMVAFASWLAEDHTHSEAFAAVEKLFDDMALAAVKPVPDTQTQLNFRRTGSYFRSPAEASLESRFCQTCYLLDDGFTCLGCGVAVYGNTRNTPTVAFVE